MNECDTNCRCLIYRMWCFLLIILRNYALSDTETFVTLHNIYNARNHDNEKYGKIVQIDCGRLHSAVVNEEGIGFLCEYNGYDQIVNGHVSDWRDGVRPFTTLLPNNA